MDSIREEYVKFISELVRYNNEVRSRVFLFLCGLVILFRLEFRKYKF